MQGPDVLIDPIDLIDRTAAQPHSHTYTPPAVALQLALSLESCGCSLWRKSRIFQPGGMNSADRPHVPTRISMLPCRRSFLFVQLRPEAVSGSRPITANSATN
ncbi:hypothetical protein CLAIMM_09343 [Cladophialophora immunda]|nr:hypothetical protein CLAIMM_09343 [Cladophialophora immunda]